MASPDAPDSTRARWTCWLQSAAIVAAASFVYWPALHGDWLWDDRQDIPKNLLLHDAAGLWKIWSEPWLLLDYYPLKHSVQWLQWQLWSADTFGYHVTNVALHLLSAFLIWRLLRQLGLRQGWLGALIFAVHPIAVESVAWICELKNTLSLPPLLLAASAWVAYTSEARRRDYLAALLWFLVAMLCKTSVVMFPFALLVFQWWKHGRLQVADFKRVAPFVVISLALGLVTMWFQHNRALLGDDTDVSVGPATRLAVAGLALAFYLWKSVWPVGLLPIYPRWEVTPPSWWQFLPWLGLGAVAIWLWQRRNTWGRHALLGLGWFCLHLVPVVGFVPISFMRFTWVMDHFVYASLVGVIGLVVAALEVTTERRQPARTVIAIAAVVVCMPLTLLARRHAGAFRNEEALWGFAAQHNPTGWLAQHSYAIVLMQKGQITEALARFELTLKLNPNYPEARSNYGVALRDAGRLADAETQLREALRLKPNYEEAHNNLGIVLRRLGRVDEAIGHYEAALRVKPDFADALFNLGNAYQSLGRHADAIVRYEAAARVEPDTADIHRNLAVSLLALGRVEEAKVHYERARQLDPKLPVVRFPSVTPQP